MDQNFSYLQDVLEAAVVSAVADFGTIHTILDHKQRAYLAAQVGFPPASLADSLSTNPREQSGALVRAVTQREPVFIEDVEIEQWYESLRPAARAMGVRSVYLIPAISRNGGVIGTLAMMFKRPARISGLRVGNVALYARVAGVVIEAGRLKAELVRRIGGGSSISDAEIKAAIRRLREHPTNTPLVEQIIALGDQYISQLIRELERSDRREAIPATTKLPDGWINRRSAP